VEQINERHQLLSFCQQMLPFSIVRFFRTVGFHHKFSASCISRRGVIYLCNNKLFPIFDKFYFRVKRTVNIELDKGQFIKTIKRLDGSDKLEIFNELKKSLFLKRFNDLLKSTKTDELSLDDITKEVESVRKNRYEKGKQII